MKPILSFLCLFGIILLFLSCQNNHKPYEFGKIVAIKKNDYNATHFYKGHIYIMNKPLNALIQYIVPQHGFTFIAGKLADSRIPWLKNYLIRYCLSRYDINMKEAVIENPYDYPSFNSFFTRHLKPACRPIIQDPQQIASPVDGFVSQIGEIHQDTLLQAKGSYFNLNRLLGGSTNLANLFMDGSFAIFYLSPKDYHRVHMPFNAKLRKTIFIPGKLFSVNPHTADAIPNLFARNERLVCIFDTDQGPMAVILVGAMIVGSINTVWHADTRTNNIKEEHFAGSIQLLRGEELGYFKMGSTVILLFGKDKVSWLANLHEQSVVRVGQAIGHVNNSHQ